MILLDTHVLVWFVNGERRLGRHARRQIAGEAESGTLLVSVITAWELAMLEAKRRIGLDQPILDWFDRILSRDNVVLAPLEPAIAVGAVQLTGMHPDPADRFLVATTRYHAVPLITADGRILDYAARGHLQAIDARV